MYKDYLFPFVHEFSVIQRNLLQSHSVKEIGLKTRVLTIFAREHIDSVLDVAYLTQDDLDGMTGLGARSVSDIITKTENWLIEEKVVNQKTILQYKNAYIFPFRNKLTHNQIEDLNQHWIKEAEFSPRVKNVLLKNGIQTMGQIVSIRKKDVESFHYFASACYQELYIKTSMWMKKNKKYPHLHKGNEVTIYEEDQNRLMKLSDLLKPIYPDNWNELYDLIKDEGLNEPLLNQKIKHTISNDLRIIFKCEEMRRMLKNYFLDLLGDEEYMPEKNFRMKLVQDGLPDKTMLEILVKEKICICKYHYVLQYRIGIKDYVDNCITDPRIKEIFQRRLRGETLKSIAEHFGMTKQRVDQLSRIQMNKFPPLLEDYFEPAFVWVYERYRYTPDKKAAFKKVFPDEDEIMYSYLRLRYATGIKYEHYLIKPETYDGLFSQQFFNLIPENSENKGRKRTGILSKPGVTLEKI